MTPGLLVIVAAAAAGGLLAVLAFAAAIVLSAGKPAGASAQPPERVASATPAPVPDRTTTSLRPAPKSGQATDRDRPGTDDHSSAVRHESAPLTAPSPPVESRQAPSPAARRPERKVEPSAIPIPAPPAAPKESPHTTAPRFPAEKPILGPPSLESPHDAATSTGSPSAAEAAPATTRPAAVGRETAPTPPPQRSPDQIREELRRVAHTISADEVLQALAGNKRMTDAARQALVEERPELRGIAFRWGGECRADRSHALALGKLSFEVRRMHDIMVEPLAKLGDNPEAEQQRAKAFAEGLDKQPWRSGAAIPALEQMLQPEGLPVRLQLVKMLSDIGNSDASQALAHRAMYDLSEQVRTAAIDVLKTRPRDHYEQTLLDGFRHPWQQVAWNSADAVARLGAKHLEAGLTKLLDQPDPAAPQRNESGVWVVREVACVNHFRNCLLCHASSLSPRDPARGPIPVVGQPLPNFTYQRQVGDFVRADVTYLKQDFSAMQPVEEPGRWPKMQRFDYFVRERELRPGELPAAAKGATYPQREAVRYALLRLKEGESTSLLERSAAGSLAAAAVRD